MSYSVFFSPSHFLLSPFNVQMLDPRHITCVETCMGPFFPQNNLFCPGSSSIYFNDELNLFFSFKIFLKNPVFGVHRVRYAPKIVKILLYKNLTKFVWVTRFRKANLTVRSVSSFEIYKTSSFQACTLAVIYRFVIFWKNSNFLKFYKYKPKVVSQNLICC